MNTYEEEKFKYETDIAVAEKLVRLQENQDFIDVFMKHYLEDYAITQIHNIGYRTPEQVNGFVANTMARGKFVKFMDSVLFDGNEAQQKLRDLVEDDAELLDAEEE